MKINGFNIRFTCTIIRPQLLIFTAMEFIPNTNRANLTENLPKFLMIYRYLTLQAFSFLNFCLRNYEFLLQ